MSNQINSPKNKFPVDNLLDNVTKNL
uniref:Uncharacterized protein n=1 Tax=Moumouvirus sp. 'Monve' TaxID=1128131 RepID=H2EDX6_9VIRU|nr:hypothetical protein mv_L394 [Moumouvirus Monve]